MRIALVLIFTFLLSVCSFGQWEYMGRLNVGEIEKLVKDGDNYYAVTYQGLYISKDNAVTWEFLCISDNWFPHPHVNIDFFASRGILYLLIEDDTCRQKLLKSTNNGITFEIIDTNDSHFINFTVSGDTIQYSNGSDWIVSNDGMETWNAIFLFAELNEKYNFDYFRSKYYCDGKNIYLLYKEDGIIYLENELTQLPLGFEFQQLIEGGDYVWSWVSNATESRIYRLNPKNKEFVKVFSFKSLTNNIGFCSKNYSNLKFEDNTLSFASYWLNKIYYSNSDGSVWDSTHVINKGLKEVFGSTFFYCQNKNCYISNNKGKGIC
ncbi:MAG: hypothetical protein IPO92_03105 [Saprospiraceae bacterium]|nr:hypothetical protein [Saprospiraceae bacterium]